MNINYIDQILSLQKNLKKEKKDKILRFLFLLMKWNKKFNIISMKNPQDIIKKHILDSLNLIQYIKYGNILDIGSGAGFPSLPLSIFKTKLKFYLLESKIKKISFIRYIIALLKIKNVYVYHIRLENFLLKEKFDYIISRAFIDLKLFINFFQKSSLNKCTIIIMHSYLNIEIIKKFFIKKIDKIKVINITKTTDLIGHRNLILFKINKKKVDINTKKI